MNKIFLNHDQNGFYFEKNPSKLPLSTHENPQICVLVVNSGYLFWLRSLCRGSFPKFSAVKLYGKLGIRRKATKGELNRLKRRMKITKGTKGNRYLWSDMHEVREIHFTHAEKIILGKMTLHL